MPRTSFVLRSRTRELGRSVAACVTNVWLSREALLVSCVGGLLRMQTDVVGFFSPFIGIEKKKIKVEDTRDAADTRSNNEAVHGTSITSMCQLFS